MAFDEALTQRFREALGNAQTIAEKRMMGDRAMPGFWFVDADVCDHALLGRWTALALAHAKGLPPK